MSKRQDSRKWHQQKRWVLGSLLLFPPLGIPLLWLIRWPRAIKVGGSIFSGLILLTALTGNSSEPEVMVTEPPVLETAITPKKVEPAVSIAYADAISEATSATEAISAAESSSDWEQIANQWQRVLSSLDEISLSSDDYTQAQKKIAEYEDNYEYARTQQAAIEALEAEAIAQQQAEKDAIAQQLLATEEPELVMPMEEAGDGYVGGTCKELAASGVGSDFRPGDANYTSARDRDGDGIACES